MNRRSFVRHALSGLGAAALSPSILRAAEPFAATPPLPGIPALTPIPAEPPLVPPGRFAQAAYAPLLARARAALDAHQDRNMLRDRVGLADFSASSNAYRFHIVDLISGETISYLVAHGRGSDPEGSGYLQSFSNEPDSAATSEGAYLTSVIYDGTHGASMRLVGLDPTNSNADIRAIVVHSAAYVSEDHIVTFGKVGRSEGCFVVAPHLITQVLGLLGPGRLLYADKVAQG